PARRNDRSAESRGAPVAGQWQGCGFGERPERGAPADRACIQIDGCQHAPGRWVAGYAQRREQNLALNEVWRTEMQTQFGFRGVRNGGGGLGSGDEVDDVGEPRRIDDEEPLRRVDRPAAPIHAAASEGKEDRPLEAWRRIRPLRAQRGDLPGTCS